MLAFPQRQQERQRREHGRGRQSRGCGAIAVSRSAAGQRGRDLRRGLAQGRRVHRAGGRLRQPADRLGRDRGDGDCDRDVAVSPLCRLRHRADAAAALHACGVCSGAELSAVSDGAPLSQPHPVVGRDRGGGVRRHPGLCHCRRRGLHRSRHLAGPPRRRARRYLHRAAAGGDAPQHRLDHAGGGAAVHRLRDGRSVPAAAMDPPRLRSVAAGRTSVHHARRHLRRRRRCVGNADHHVHDLRRVSAALGRRQVLYRLLDGADRRQGEQRRPHRGAVVVPAGWPVGFGRRHHGDDRRGGLSDDEAVGLREECRRRASGRWRARCHPVAAGARGRRLPDRRISQDQLPRRDLDGDHPDLSLLHVVALHGRARRQAVRRRRGALSAADGAWRPHQALRLPLHHADCRHRLHGGGLLADARRLLLDPDVLPVQRDDARDHARPEAAAVAAAGALRRPAGAGAAECARCRL